MRFKDIVLKLRTKHLYSHTFEATAQIPQVETVEEFVALSGFDNEEFLAWLNQELERGAVDKFRKVFYSTANVQSAIEEGKHYTPKVRKLR